MKLVLQLYPKLKQKAIFGLWEGLPCSNSIDRDERRRLLHSFIEFISYFTTQISRLNIQQQTIIAMKISEIKLAK